MSYTHARHNKKTEQIDIVERINGKRLFNSYPMDFSFYIDDPNGQYRSLLNTPVTKIVPKTRAEMYKEIGILNGSGKKMWESDLNPVFKCISTNYRHKEVPDLHIALFDIETGFSKYKYPEKHAVKIRKK